MSVKVVHKTLMKLTPDVSLFFALQFQGRSWTGRGHPCDCQQGQGSSWILRGHHPQGNWIVGSKLPPCLCSALMRKDPKSIKIHSSHQYLFVLLGSASVKVSINYLSHITRESCNLFYNFFYVQQVKTSDAGSYSVLASNTAGAAECMAVIGVKGDRVIHVWRHTQAHIFTHNIAIKRNR